MLSIISYIRVSDKKQGRSGLGLKAQQQAIDRFTQFEGLKVVKKFDEVETAKGGDALERRPQLRAALSAAKKLGCYVVVSKLCRLSRNVHFISGLMEKEVPFVTLRDANENAVQNHALECRSGVGGSATLVGGASGGRSSWEAFRKGFSAA